MPAERPAAASADLTEYRSLGQRAPLLWLVLPLMTGLVIGRAGEFLPVAWQLAGAAAAAVAAVICAWRWPRGWAPALGVAMVLAGTASYALHRPHHREWEQWPKREAKLSLRVDRVFESKRAWAAEGLATIVKTEPHLRELQGHRVFFSLALPKGDTTAPARSAVIATVGELIPLPYKPGRSFESSLADAGIDFMLSYGRILGTDTPPSWYYAWLETLAQKTSRWLGAGVAQKRPALTAIFRAMMLGRKNELSTEQKETFMDSGTMHLFAINGLHIGVVALALHALCRLLRLPRPVAALVTLAVLWLDVDTTGAAPSAVRAFLLVACIEAGAVLRRRPNGTASLATAALLALLIDPLALFSAGFQMSYGVVFVILGFGVPLGEYLVARFAPFQDLPKPTWARWQHAAAWLSRWGWTTLAIGTAAALMSAITGPEFFQTFAPGGFGINLLLVPLATLVIIAGFVSVLLGAIGLGASGVLFNHAAIVVLWVIDRLIHLGLHVPGSWWTVQWRTAWAAPAAMVALLAVVLWSYGRRLRDRKLGWWPPFAVVAISLAAGLKFGS